MNTTNSILFVLDLDLEVHQLSFVNNDHKVEVQHTHFLAKLSREKKTLELTDRFESLWTTLQQKPEVAQASHIYFFRGPKAGFTDTRVITLWLRSYQLFHPEKHVFWNTFTDFSVTNEQSPTHSHLLQSAKPITKSIGYSAEPRIGGNT